MIILLMGRMKKHTSRLPQIGGSHLTLKKGGDWHDSCHGQQKIVQNKLIVCVDSQGILH
jgi:hypothetical protein